MIGKSILHYKNLEKLGEEGVLINNYYCKQQHKVKLRIYYSPPTNWSVYNITNQSTKNTKALRFNSNCSFEISPTPA